MAVSSRHHYLKSKPIPIWLQEQTVDNLRRDWDGVVVTPLILIDLLGLSVPATTNGIRLEHCWGWESGQVSLAEVLLLPLRQEPEGGAGGLWLLPPHSL